MRKQDLIKAYESGKTIQALYKNSIEWKDLVRPQFKDGVKYRVKPENDLNDDGLKPAMLFGALGLLVGALLTHFAG